MRRVRSLVVDGDAVPAGGDGDQAGMVRNEIGLSCGLSGVSGRLLYVDRP
jgi:hypothetical protein